MCANAVLEPRVELLDDCQRVRSTIAADVSSLEDLDERFGLPFDSGLRIGVTQGMRPGAPAKSIVSAAV